MLGPNAAFADEGYIFVYQDVRGRFRSEGEFVHHAPHIAGRRRRPNESTDTYDTIDWLLKNVPTTTAASGMYGHLVSRVGYACHGHASTRIRRSRRPRRRPRPPDQFLGDDFHSQRRLPAGYAFNWMSANARPERPPSDAPARDSTTARPTATSSSWMLGAAANAQQPFPQTQVPTWNDYMTHGTYDEYWQARNVPKDLDEHHARRCWSSAAGSTPRILRVRSGCSSASRRRAPATPRGSWSARGRTAAGRAARANRSATIRSESKTQ